MPQLITVAMLDLVMKRTAGRDGEIERLAMKWNLTRDLAERRLARETYGQTQPGDK